MPLPRLVYLSPVPLSSFAQRPHHFVEWFHKRFDAEVLWIDPYPARLPRWHDVHRLFPNRSAPVGAAWANAPWIRTVQPHAVPLEPLASGRAINHWLWSDLMRKVSAFTNDQTWLVVGKPCALAVRLADSFPMHRVVFDVMDNMPAFARGVSQTWLASTESAMVARSGALMASSTPLHALLESRYKRPVSLVKNATTVPESTRVPAWAESTTAKPPGTPLTMGYIGSISSWFDWDLVERLARHHLSARIELIGPCDQRPRYLPANVFVLPPQRQEDIHRTMLTFDVGLIPFQMSALTDYVDPVKFYEYRAAGLPVLSSRFGEMRLRGQQDGVVFFEDLAAQDMASDWPWRHNDAGTTEQFVRANNWKVRFDQMPWVTTIDRP